MEAADARYQSFLVRIWREGEADGAAEDGWLLQVEDIASGDTRYFHSSSALVGYMDAKLRTDAGSATERK